MLAEYTIPLLDSASSEGNSRVHLPQLNYSNITTIDHLDKSKESSNQPRTAMNQTSSTFDFDFKPKITLPQHKRQD